MKLFFLLFFSTISFSQINCGRITYGIVIGKDDKYQENDNLKDYYQLAIDNAKNVNFELLIKNRESFFRIMESDQIDKNGVSLTLSFGGYIAPIYSDNNSKFFYTYNDDPFLGKFTQKKEKNETWILTNETKIIENYICYKATAIDTVVNSAGTFKFEVIAWYCPKIPISSGPNGYGGLPGLILELNRRNIVYGAKKVELNPEILSEIPKPDLSIVKTEEDVIKMREDFINSMKD